MRLIDADALMQEYARFVALSNNSDVPTWNDAVSFLESAPTIEERKWISCTDQLPENQDNVLVCYRYREFFSDNNLYNIVIGWYAHKNKAVVDEMFGFDTALECDYDEEKDEYYLREGWYESFTQGNNEPSIWYINNAEVVAWMPLPEPHIDGLTKYRARMALRELITGGIIKYTSQGCPAIESCGEYREFVRDARPPINGYCLPKRAFNSEPWKNVYSDWCKSMEEWVKMEERT